METPRHSKNNVQLVWGLALILMGVAVFFRIPQVMPKFAEMWQSATTIGFIRACFYLMGFLLVGGGTKKVLGYMTGRKINRKGTPVKKDDV